MFWGDWQIVKRLFVYVYLFSLFCHFSSIFLQIFWPDMASLECSSKAAAQAGVCAAEAWDLDFGNGGADCCNVFGG